MIRLLANDRSIIIKKANKGFCVVVWDRMYYIAEAEKQLEDRNVYEDIDFDLQKLVIVVSQKRNLNIGHQLAICYSRFICSCLMFRHG